MSDGDPNVHRLTRKLFAFREALSRQDRQGPYAASVPVVEGISSAEFYDRFYFSNRPVVLKGLMNDWPALRLWSPEFLADNFGDCEIEITAEREVDPRYEENFAQHCRTVRMDQYVRTLLEGGATNDYYLVARNFALDREGLRPLLDHVRCPVGFLDPAGLPGRIRLWFGQAGTVTPLHHDAMNILFGQVYGRKCIRLVSWHHLDSVYNERACYSAVDLDALDLDRFPKMRHVAVQEVVVGPGDFLFIPIGWWHWVRALDVSISLSFHNFVVPGGSVIWYEDAGDSGETRVSS